MEKLYHRLLTDESSKNLRKPKPWKHTQPITPAQLKQMRDEFWDTAPHYGGQKAHCLCRDLGRTQGRYRRRFNPCADHSGQCRNHRIES
uniref:DC-UbP/UBTD2 N-terminal domain-containing protein n=1 Tax=Aegilops tauschii subsp. strangulata TaxID=200361 RepID=A0A452ZMB0_AEGTS